MMVEMTAIPEGLTLPQSIGGDLKHGATAEDVFAKPVRAKRANGVLAAEKAAHVPVRPRIDTERQRKVVELFLSGSTYDQIVEATGVSYNTVGRIVKRHGAKRPSVRCSCKHENPKTASRCRLAAGHRGWHRWWTSVLNSTKLALRWNECQECNGGGFVLIHVRAGFCGTRHKWVPCPCCKANPEYRSKAE